VRNRIKDLLECSSRNDISDLENKERALDKIRSHVSDLQFWTGKAEEQAVYIKDLKRCRRIKKLQMRPKVQIPSWVAPALFCTVICFVMGAYWRHGAGDLVGGALFLATATIAIITSTACYLNLKKPDPDTKSDVETIENALCENEARMVELEQYMLSCQSMIEQDAQSAELSPNLSIPEMIALSAELRRMRDHTIIITERREQFEKGDARLQIALLEEKEQLDQCRNAERSKILIHKQWEEFKAEARFPAALTPEGIVDSFHEINRAKDLITVRDEMWAPVAEIQEELSIWEDRARGLLMEACGDIEEFLSGWQLVESFESLVLRCKKQNEKKEDINRLEETIENLIVEIKKDENDLAQSNERLESLLSKAGVDTVEKFKSKIEGHSEREKLKEQIEGSESKISRLIGIGRDADNMLVEVKAGSVIEWNNLKEEAEEKQALIAQRQSELLKSLDSAKSQLAAVEGAVDLQAVQAELNRKKVSLDRALHEWRVLRIANGLMRTALDSYIDEDHPAAIRRASELFGRITDGFYTSLALDEKRMSITVEDATGVWKTPDQLNGAAAEQLYLCMRMGIVDAFTKHKAPLPIIMDDMLVNFDPDRARRMGEVLNEMSAETQILLFTCQPHTVDLLQEVIPDLRVEELNRENSLVLR